MYVTNEPGESLYEMNFASGVTTPLWTVDGRPDSLIVYPPTSPTGKIIYTVALSRQLEMFDPATGLNTVLLSFGSTSPIPGYPRDLILEPSGTSLLVGLYSPGKIVRYNILTGTETLLSKNLGALDGLAYDPAGDLFAVSKRNTIVQIDPVTGLVLKTLVLEPRVGTNGADGLVYDTYTGQLWASTDGYGKTPGPLANGIIEVPTDLSGFTTFQIGKISVPDGIVSDGKGNLYIGAGLGHIVQYNIPTDTIVKSVKAPGVDDVALIPGTY